MKVQAIGFVRVEGVSDKSGALKPYDMCRLLILQPVEISSKQDDKTGTRFSKTGGGFESAEVDMDSGAISQFSGIKFPANLDIEIGQKMQFGRLASICTGLKV